MKAELEGQAAGQKEEATLALAKQEEFHKEKLHSQKVLHDKVLKDKDAQLAELTSEAEILKSEIDQVREEVETHKGLLSEAENLLKEVNKRHQNAQK